MIVSNVNNLKSASNSKTSKYITFITILSLVALNFVWAIGANPALQLGSVDGEVYRYIGMVIANGGSPYSDAFDHKPPLIFLLNAVSFPSEYWGIWFVERCIAGLILVVFYLILKREGSAAPLGVTVVFCA
jgi:hypothetical protein